MELNHVWITLNKFAAEISFDTQQGEAASVSKM